MTESEDAPTLDIQNTGKAPVPGPRSPEEREAWREAVEAKRKAERAGEVGLFVDQIGREAAKAIDEAMVVLAQQKIEIGGCGCCDSPWISRGEGKLYTDLVEVSVREWIEIRDLEGEVS